ncbi:MAG: hypothetical protein CM1200mP41_02310 [Gammaproteobacteria bacterium]|nr:MAG: hypothetical protein CM1200mP41_02310 [Gammaproteobacteria bacterium]
MNARLKKILSRISFYIGVATFALFCGFPMIWMVLTSIKPDGDILRATPVFWSWDTHLDHYRNLFDQTDFLIYFVNSITVATSATLLTIVIATLAGVWYYTLSFHRPRIYRRWHVVHVYVCTDFDCGAVLYLDEKLRLD